MAESDNLKTAPQNDQENKRKEVKEKVLNLLRKVRRPGIDDMIRWLEESSFFDMPASTRFHGNYDGGLAEHSLNVYEAFVKLRNTYLQQFGGSDTIPIESVIICSLCHDFCKIDLYHKDYRNVKNRETGQWEQKEVYTYADPYGLGHGECSMYLVQSFINLNMKEAQAIRWHMGAYDSAVKGGDYSINVGMSDNPLATLLNMADTWASTFMEETR